MKYYTLAAHSVKENFRAAASKTVFACFLRGRRLMFRGRVKGSRHVLALITRNFVRASPMNDPPPYTATLDHGSRLPARATSWHNVGFPSSFSTKIFVSGLAERAPPRNIGKPEKNCTLRDVLGNGSERNHLPIVGHPFRSMATTNDAGRARAPQTMTDPTTSMLRRRPP
jgi:hypothetical protein